MSTASVLPLTMNPLPPFSRQTSAPHRNPIRRRTSPEQGRALEVLGHAIEYLVDSRLFETWESPADAQAVQTLMSCSRQVFAACEDLSPWHKRVQRALVKKLHLQVAPVRHG